MDNITLGLLIHGNMKFSSYRFVVFLQQIDIMKLFSLLLCVFLIVPVAQDTIKIDDKYKVQGTFSGNTSGENSFHLVIAKNRETKLYDVLPFLYEKETITSIEPIEFDQKIDIVSFHNNGDVLTLITQKKKRKSSSFNVVDIDLKSGTHKISGDIDTEDFKTVLRTKDQNFLVFARHNRILIQEINRADSIKAVRLLSSEKNEEFLKRLSENRLDAINQQEFIANGSASEHRLYKNGDDIIITKDSHVSNKTSVLKINMSSDEENLGVIDTYYNASVMNKVKKQSSYLFNDKIYQVKVSKKKAIIDIFNMDNDQVQQIDLTGNEISKVISDQENLNKFVKQASRSKNQPTITVNTTASNALKVRLNYVNVNTYSFQNNWWWHHQWVMQNMMWQQQMMQQQMMQNVQNSLPKFGPNAPDAPLNFIPFNYSNTYVEFAIDPSGELKNSQDLQSQFKEIDKKDYVDRLENKAYIKNPSSVFTDSVFRYFGYDTYTKSYVIKEERIR